MSEESIQAGETLASQEKDSFLQMRLSILPTAPKDAGGLIVVEIVSASTGRKYTEIYQSITLDKWSRKTGRAVYTDRVYPVPKGHRATIVHKYGHVGVEKFVYLLSP